MMSYCRWNEDSDIYTWEDVYGGWISCVAHGRHVFSEDHPIPPEPDWRDVDSIIEWNQQRQIAYDHATLIAINGPYDGQRLVANTAKECSDQLLMLREHGYIVPQYAIDELLDEAADA